MIEVVIKYDESKKEYLVYEPTTNSLMASTNLTESLVLLNKFLLDSGMSQVDLLQCPDISYHIDSYTMRAIVEGNIQLMKRLNTAPSGFMISNQRFGQNGIAGGQKPKPQQTSSDSKQKSKGKQRGLGFAGASGFKSAFKKFGGKKF